MMCHWNSSSGWHTDYVITWTCLSFVVVVSSCRPARACTVRNPWVECFQMELQGKCLWALMNKQGQCIMSNVFTFALFFSCTYGLQVQAIKERKKKWRIGFLALHSYEAMRGLK